MNNIIETKNMCKSFKLAKEKISILKNINLNIEEGKFVSIMGPSGCGKSTLLYLLGGLDKPSSGSVSILGKDYSSMKENQKSIMRRRDLGFVFQFYKFKYCPSCSVEIPKSKYFLLLNSEVSNS